jgi:hypothetical protein
MKPICKTDHDELVNFLRAQQDQINALSATLERVIASTLFNQSSRLPKS